MATRRGPQTDRKSKTQRSTRPRGAPKKTYTKFPRRRAQGPAGPSLLRSRARSARPASRGARPPSKAKYLRKTLTPPGVDTCQRLAGLAALCDSAGPPGRDESTTIPEARTLKLASTTFSNPSRRLGAAGDARCFDAAEPRLGPPNEAHGAGGSRKQYFELPTLSGPLAWPWEPTAARAARHARSADTREPPGTRRRALNPYQDHPWRSP